MFFKQFYLDALGHASYLLGSEQTGEALLFDPRRDVDEYLAEARRQGLRIAYAMDSHGHNDYLSGLTEVAARQDVTVLGYADAGLGYLHRPVGDGHVLRFGEVRVEVVHTPGHTPEHVSLMVTDLEQGEEPALLLSGGALLAGDLARPDLLGGPEQAREAAQVFCDTIQRRILPMPDYIEVFPTHVAGSLCGGNIGSRLSTTVGYERRTNAILAEVSTRDDFVRECLRLDNLPGVPPYWQRMRRQNMAGVAPLGVLAEPPALPVAEFAQLQQAGAVVLDCRQPEAYGAGHVPGALNAGLGASFPTWAGTVIPEGARILLVVDRPDDVWEATWHLLRIGYDLPVGWLAGGMYAWRTSAAPLARLPQITVPELRERVERGEVQVLDVRQPAEWYEGHIEGATFITGAELPERLEEAPRNGPLAVVCGSGYRSSASASLLLREGRREVLNVLGGMSAWERLDYPTVE